MRSAETSGASVTGFGAGQVKADRHAKSKGRAAPRNPYFQFATPLTHAVALTALIAATLFILHDALRSFEDAQRELATMGSTLVKDIVSLTPAQIDSALDAANRRFIAAGRASLVAAETIPSGPMLAGL